MLATGQRLRQLPDDDLHERVVTQGLPNFQQALASHVEDDDNTCRMWSRKTTSHGAISVEADLCVGAAPSPRRTVFQSGSDDRTQTRMVARRT
jgi:hypothetical protein